MSKGKSSRRPRGAAADVVDPQEQAAPEQTDAAQDASAPGDVDAGGAEAQADSHAAAEAAVQGHPEAEVEASAAQVAEPVESVDAQALAELAPRVEAALLSTDRALPSARLCELFNKLTTKRLTQVIDELNRQYAATGRSFRIEQVAGGWQVLTLPQFGDVLNNLHRSRAQSKLSPAAMETLAIIAYRQPILRAEIEAVRGVACGEVLRSLMERRLVKIVGRSDELGRPMLYGTTNGFLEVFGLASLKDLPKAEELRQPARKLPSEAAKEATDAEGKADAEAPSGDAAVVASEGAAGEAVAEGAAKKREAAPSRESNA